MKKLLEAFEKELTAKTPDATKTAEAVLTFLENQDTSQAIFLLGQALGFMKYLPEGETHNKFPGVTDTQWEKAIKKHHEPIIKTITKIMDKDQAVIEKMAKLWHYLRQLKTREEKILALCVLFKMKPLLLDEERQGEITISDDEFNQTLQSNIERYIRAGFICHTHMSIAKRSITMLNLLDGIIDRKVRVAVASGMKTKVPPMIETLLATFELEPTNDFNASAMKSIKSDKDFRRKLMSMDKISTEGAFKHPAQSFGAALRLIETETEINRRIILMGMLMENSKQATPSIEISILKI